MLRVCVAKPEEMSPIRANSPSVSSDSVFVVAVIDTRYQIPDTRYQIPDRYPGAVSSCGTGEFDLLRGRREHSAAEYSSTAFGGKEDGGREKQKGVALADAK